MPAELQNQPGESSASRPGNKPTKQLTITTELVQAIADRIYAMLLHDLRIERERERLYVREGRK